MLSHRPEPPGSPAISVVIATYNRATQLQRCLRAIEALTYPLACFELIVVDDGSPDTTWQVLETFGRETHLRFTRLRQANGGPGAARNAGIKKASGEFIAFTDDDCTPDPNWLQAYVAGFKDAKIGGLGGPIRDISINTVSRYLGLHHVVTSHFAGTEIPPFLVTANACYRRQCLAEAGGFDEQLKHPGGEDPDLSWRVLKLGYRLDFCPEAGIQHHHKTGVREFARSYYYYGQGYRYVQQKHQLPPVVGSLARNALKTLSPRQFGYRIKTYAGRHNVRWPDAVGFAVLDQVRELAWQWGYASLTPTLPAVV